MSTTAVSMPVAPRAVPVVRRRGPRLLSSLLSRFVTVVALTMLLIVMASGLLAPVIAPHPPRAGDLLDSKLPPAWLPDGDARFVLGTDELGRDILSRVMYGAQISLMVGFTAVALAGALGVGVGLVAGYFRGPVDDVIMRVADIQLALPQILMAIAILAVLGPGLQNVILTLAITNWVIYARVVRGEVLSVREKDYVQAARCVGVGHLPIGVSARCAGRPALS